MPNYLSLNNLEHKNVRVLEKKSLELFATTGNCNITFDELFSVSGCFPIFLIKDPADGSFHLSAIFGLKNNQNLFAEQTKWTAPYCPLNLKRLPFAISNSGLPEDENTHTIYIDTESTLLSDQDGVRIFDDSGEETAFLKDKKRVLGAIIQGQEKTTQFIDTLLTFDLVSAMNINLTLLNGSQSIAGLYAIDHLRMQSMGKDVYQQLYDKSFLESVFLMKASYSQLNRLVWLENQHCTNTIVKYSMSPVPGGVI